MNPTSVLVVVTRRIGDVLLATPVLRSLKQSWPEAAIDMLVFEGTEGVVAANPDARSILTVPQRPGALAHMRLFARMFRQYDLALSLTAGDRPTLYAFNAGRRRRGLLLNNAKEAWKRRLLDEWVPFDNLNMHTVRMNLALVQALGITPLPEVVVSWSAADESQVAALLGAQSEQPLAVLHPYPKFNYKMWHKAGWGEIAHWLDGRGYRVVLTGGSDPLEIAFVADVASDMPSGVINAAGRLSLSASANLVSRARVYVGPDTALTHVAAALGVPTVAIYGPTDPVKWGPWPKGHRVDNNPWRRIGSARNGNVILLQGSLPCVPCHLEGCDRHIASFSDCLMQLPAARVIAALRDVLEIGDR